MADNDRVEMLLEWLKTNEIDTTLWGKSNGSKTVQDLWNEVHSGETSLQNNPPMRVLHIVQMIIKNGSKVLKEDYQERAGVKRSRGGYPTEKILPGETPYEAALRGLEEELRIKPDDASPVHVSQCECEEMRVSRSYPGLMTKYIIYKVEFAIPSLPHSSFQTVETPHVHDKPVIIHAWMWSEDRA